MPTLSEFVVDIIVASISDGTKKKKNKEKREGIPGVSQQEPNWGQLSCHWLRQAMLTFYKDHTLSTCRLAFNGKPYDMPAIVRLCILCLCICILYVNVYMCVYVYVHV